MEDPSLKQKMWEMNLQLYLDKKKRMPCASFLALSGKFFVIGDIQLIGDIREVALGNVTCVPLTSTLNLLSTQLTTKSFSFNRRSSQFNYLHIIKGTHLSKLKLFAECPQITFIS